MLLDHFEFMDRSPSVLSGDHDAQARLAGGLFSDGEPKFQYVGFSDVFFTINNRDLWELMVHNYGSFCF